MALVSLYSNKNITKTEVDTSDWGTAVVGLHLFGGTCTLVVWIWNGVFQVLLNGPYQQEHGRQWYKVLFELLEATQNVSEEKNFSMLPKYQSCDILVEKKVAALCLCSEILPEAKVKWQKKSQKSLLQTLYLCHVIFSVNWNEDI